MTVPSGTGEPGGDESRRTRPFAHADGTAVMSARSVAAGNRHDADLLGAHRGGRASGSRGSSSRIGSPSVDQTRGSTAAPGVFRTGRRSGRANRRRRGSDRYGRRSSAAGVPIPGRPRPSAPTVRPARCPRTSSAATVPAGTGPARGLPARAPSRHPTGGAVSAMASRAAARLETPVSGGSAGAAGGRSRGATKGARPSPRLQEALGDHRFVDIRHGIAADSQRPRQVTARGHAGTGMESPFQHGKAQRAAQLFRKGDRAFFGPAEGYQEILWS